MTVWFGFLNFFLVLFLFFFLRLAETECVEGLAPECVTYV
jgi:hypothetical protein